MTTSVVNGQASIQAMCEAYRDARARILQSPNPQEQSVGLATLRLEATHTYRELVTTGRGLTETDLAPLKEYVVSLTGGEGAEWVVSKLDAEAKKLGDKVLGDLTSSLLAGTAVGAVTTIIGLVAAASGAAVAAGNAIGAELIPMLLGGGSVLMFFVRAGQVGSNAAASAWVHSWTWATSLGRASDVAMEPARKLQVAFWRAVTGAPWTYSPFTEKARERAKLMVGAAWTLVVIGGLLVGYGFLQALDAWQAGQSSPVIVPG